MNTETLIPASPSEDSRVTDTSQPPALIRPRRILVVDDDELTRRVISIVLARAHLNVNTAADGEQAWEALSHEHYDLLVTDNDMPRLAGISLIERMREAGMSLPVIIVSGSLPIEKLCNNRELQITTVLPKPFGISELLDAVRYALPRIAEPLNVSNAVHNRILIADDPRPTPPFSGDRR